jgi:excisionase family DNA binding protein
MNTIGLEEAAKFLKIHPETLRRKARAGEVPGRKVGKGWVFILSQLADWIAEPYSKSRQVPQVKEAVWPFTNAAMVRSTSRSPTHELDEQYASLLEPPTGRRPRNSRTG